MELKERNAIHKKSWILKTGDYIPFKDFKIVKASKCNFLLYNKDNYIIKSDDIKDIFDKIEELEC